MIWSLNFVCYAMKIRKLDFADLLLPSETANVFALKKKKSPAGTVYHLLSIFTIPFTVRHASPLTEA